jgi:GNAT superfamily N-acetyltransferase
MHRFDALGDDDLRSAPFIALLREAAGQSDGELHRLIADVLPGLESVGVRGDNALLAFAAFHPGAGATTLEYLAVDASQRGRGLGAALIRSVRAQHPSLPLIAETDDDAVGFYSRLGFSIEEAASDPRWPGRRRYRCALPPLPAE